jgi:crotonobetainyl-CoA:carnitine CoA-transferase CaiB-like acyl-CoA transferase
MERLGLGPDVALASNPKLVYGRSTGWGQSGPYSQAGGHDINYIALAGALDLIGRQMKQQIAAAFKTQDSRRVARAHEGYRRVFRPSALPCGGGEASSQHPS